MSGKGLSTNDFTTTYKNKLDGLTTTTSITSGSSSIPTSGTVYTALSNKVDTESGKGLSTNDFTTSYKDKLDSITVIKSIGNNLILDNNGKLSCDLSGVGGQSLYFNYGYSTRSGSTTGGQKYYEVLQSGSSYLSSENRLDDNTVIFKNTNTSNPYNENLYVWIYATSVPCYDGRSNIDSTYMSYLASTITFQANCIFAKQTSYINFYTTNYTSGSTQAMRQQIGWLFGMIGARGSLKMIYTAPTS